MSCYAICKDIVGPDEDLGDAIHTGMDSDHDVVLSLFEEEGFIIVPCSSIRVITDGWNSVV